MWFAYICNSHQWPSLYRVCSAMFAISRQTRGNSGHAFCRRWIIDRSCTCIGWFALLCCSACSLGWKHRTSSIRNTNGRCSWCACFTGKFICWPKSWSLAEQLDGIDVFSQLKDISPSKLHRVHPVLCTQYSERRGIFPERCKLWSLWFCRPAHFPMALWSLSNSKWKRISISWVACQELERKLCQAAAQRCGRTCGQRSSVEWPNDDCLQELFKSFYALQQECWRSFWDPTASLFIWCQVQTNHSFRRRSYRPKTEVPHPFVNGTSVRYKWRQPNDDLGNLSSITLKIWRKLFWSSRRKNQFNFFIPSCNAFVPGNSILAESNRG